MLRRAGSNNVPLLNGSGVPDGGRGQLAAQQFLALELENIYEALNTALNRDDLACLFSRAAAIT